MVLADQHATHKKRKRCRGLAAERALASHGIRIVPRPALAIPRRRHTMAYVGNVYQILEGSLLNLPEPIFASKHSSFKIFKLL